MIPSQTVLRRRHGFPRIVSPYALRQRRPQFKLFGIALLGAFVTLNTWGQAAFRHASPPTNAAPPSPILLTNLAQLRQLERDQAQLAHPVHVRATVTYVEDQWPSLFIQDDTAAVYVFPPKDAPTLAAGDVVDVIGNSDVGFTPVVRATSIQVVGSSPLPDPVPTTLEELATGRHDCFRVSVTTTIRWMFVAYHRLYMHVGESSARYEIQVPHFHDPLPAHLLDARVRITGVAGVKASHEGHLLGLRITFGSIDELVVLEPAPAQPWDRSTQLIWSLMWFHPSTSYGQRTKVSGVVTLRTPSGHLFVQDDSAAVEVRLPPIQERADPAGQYLEPPVPADLRPGDLVEVLGYPALGRHAPVLVDAWVRATGIADLPEPTLLSATNALQGHLDARWVQLEGRLVASDTRSLRDGVAQRLTLDDHGSLFLAEYEGPEPLHLDAQSRLRVTGVSIIEVDEWQYPRSFRLLIGAPTDVKVIARPPRFTAGNVLRVTIPVGLFLTAWVWWLRRQIAHERIVAHERDRMRTAIQQLNTDLERRVAERTRLAHLTAEVAVTLSENAALQSMLQRCTDQLVKHLNATSAAIWTLDQTGLELRAAAGNGASPILNQGVPLDHSPVGRAAQSAKPVVTGPDKADANTSQTASGVVQDVSSHVAALPLLLDGRLIGVVELRGPHAISEDELKALASVADSLALGIERKSAEAALSDSEARYRTMTEHSPQAIVVIDTDTRRFVEVNGNAVRLFGLERARLLELGPADVSPPLQPNNRPSSQAAADRIEEALAGIVPLFQWTHRHANGRDIPCEVRVARIPSPGRRLVIASVTDITERKRAEKGLLEALAREKELSELKGNFVSMVSHEFRTPLGVILSAAEILDRYLDRLPPEKRRSHLQMICRATRNLGHLIEEVLVLSKVEQGQIKYTPSPMDLTAFCRQLADEVLSATNRSCPIAFHPDTLANEAHGDPGLLRHILTNLLSNAVKYSLPGSPVDLHVSQAGTAAVFIVRDRGIGISEEDRKNLFKSFSRGKNVDQRPGTGLGLVIVKRCVELHGGHITLDSQLGSGTTVTVSLPMFLSTPPHPPDAPHAITDSNPALS